MSYQTPNECLLWHFSTQQKKNCSLKGPEFLKQSTLKFFCCLIGNWLQLFCLVGIQHLFCLQVIHASTFSSFPHPLLQRHTPKTVNILGLAETRLKFYKLHLLGVSFGFFFFFFLRIQMIEMHENFQNRGRLSKIHPLSDGGVKERDRNAFKYY